MQHHQLLRLSDEISIDCSKTNRQKCALNYNSSPVSPSSPSSFSSNWIQDMIEACRVGDEFLVNELLKEKVEFEGQLKREELIRTYNINALERTSKKSAIHYCMAGNHLNILLLLLSAFSMSGSPIVLDVNLRETKTGTTPLHIAVVHNSKECIELFLTTSFVTMRLEREAKDVYGNTVFHVAYRLKRFEIMDMLISCFGNDIINSKKSNSETCLHVAAKKSDSKGLIWLLKRGAKLQSKDENGRRPLISSIYNYRESCNSEGLISGHNTNSYNNCNDCNTNLILTPQSPNSQIHIGLSLHSNSSSPTKYEEITPPQHTNALKRMSKRMSPDDSSDKISYSDSDFSPEITNRMRRSLCYCILIQKEIELICDGNIKKWIKNEIECPDGINIFQQAALNGNKEFLSVCSLLMDKTYFNQILFERKDKRKYNILHFACEGAHFPVLELISNQAIEMYSHSPQDLTQQLKQLFNAKDSTPLQETPLHKAARRMETLMESKDQHQQGIKTANREKENAIQCMTFLMYSNYTDMNIKNANGETPNHILQRCGFFSSQFFLYNKKN